MDSDDQTQQTPGMDTGTPVVGDESVVVGGDAPAAPPVADSGTPMGQVPPAPVVPPAGGSEPAVGDTPVAPPAGGEDPVAPPAPQEPDGDEAPAM